MLPSGLESRRPGVGRWPPIWASERSEMTPLCTQLCQGEHRGRVVDRGGDHREAGEPEPVHLAARGAPTPGGIERWARACRIQSQRERSRGRWLMARPADGCPTSGPGAGTTPRVPFIRRGASNPVPFTRSEAPSAWARPVARRSLGLPGDIGQADRAPLQQAGPGGDWAERRAGGG